jgi:hypothetical protein
MNKRVACLGASAVALWGMTCVAEAKKVYYEIDGVRYSYSTNNRQQVREARERINAANAADAAKAKAQAERAANPLAALFGSPAQTAAREAEARVKQGPAPSGSAAEGETAAAPEARRERRRALREAGRERAALARAAARTPKPPPMLVSAARRPERAQAATATGAAEAAKVTAKAVTKPAPAEAPASAVKSVFYDLSSGIKTVQMSDGTVHEELFDTSNVPALGAGAAGNLTDFVNGLRKPAPEDSTGTLAKPRTEN